MRTTGPLAMTVGLLLAVVGLRTFADDRPAHPRPAMAPVEARFRETVRPFLETYCLRVPRPGRSPRATWT